MKAILGKVFQLIERGWVRNVPAQTSYGRRVEATSIEAVSWSLFGALAARAEPMSADWEASVQAILEATKIPSPVALLDWSEEPQRTQADILLAIRKAML